MPWQHARWFLCGSCKAGVWELMQALYTNDYLAEFNNHIKLTAEQALDLPVLSLVVWTLKREVRASGECLGMYRR